MSSSGAERREERSQERRTASLVLPPLLTTLAFAALLLLLYLTGILGLVYDKAALGEWVRASGALAPLAFLALLAVRPFTLFPSMWLAPVAAALFGWVWGAALKVLGETLGATLAFLAARYGFRRAFGRILRRLLPRLGTSMDTGFVARLGGVLGRRGFLAVLALRCNLLLPFDALNYGLGFTTLRPIPYAAGTLIGIIPGTFLYVGLAGSALEGAWLPIVLTIAGIAAMILLSVPLARDLMRDRAAAPPGPAPGRRDLPAAREDPESP